VNPQGDETAREVVVLINRTAREVTLNGWSLADKDKRKKSLQGLRLAAYGTATVAVRQNSQMQLSNDGGIITLLDDDGIKIHGVSYTKQDAAREGWLVLF
jgi:hypothetical protein